MLPNITISQFRKARSPCFHVFGLILLLTFYISVSGYSETRLDTDTLGAGESWWPVITSDNSGHVYVTWRDKRNGKGDIYFNYSSDYGATWQADDIRLDTNDAGDNNSRWPVISCDNSGHVYVVWNDRRDVSTLFDIYFNYSSDYGASWSGDVELGTDLAAGHSVFPQIINDGSYVYVAWMQLQSGAWNVYFNYSSDNGLNWQANSTRLDSGADHSWWPEISSDGGNVYVTWEDYRNADGTSDVYFNDSSDYGATWSGDKRIDTGTGNTWWPQISCDSGGNVYVTWEDYRNGDGSADVYFNRSTDNGLSFVDEKRLDNPAGTSETWWPEMSSDGSGNVYVTWMDDRSAGGAWDAYFDYSNDYGATWQASDKKLDVGDATGTSDSWWPRINSNSSGYVYVTWYDERDTGADIYFYYSNDYGVTWQASETRLDIGDTAGTSNALYPEITSDTNGHIYVTWYDERDGGPDIYFDILASSSTNANVISIGDNWNYIDGLSYPGATWADISFDDSAWLTGPTGIGYGDSDDATVLSGMQGSYMTMYARKTFTVSDASVVTGITFRIDYDDGFVAYINGVEVARANMPGGTPNENTSASSAHEAGIPEVFDLSSYRGNLVTGNNVLAIEMHNSTINNNDLSMIPQLEIETSTVGDLLQTNDISSTGDNWNYFKGTSNPGAGWDDVSFDDSAWLVGPIGIGFGDGDDATVLSDMQGSYTTVYARKAFSLSDVSAITDMTLRMDYDDGFVAYINGVEVTRANMPVGSPDNTTNASSGHEAGTPETFDLSSYTGSLVVGTNVLAIEIHNSDIGNNDLSMIPELYIVSQVGGALLDVTSPTIPANLTATAVLSSQINLSWDASTDDVAVSGYKIYRDGGGTPIATITGTTYSDTGLSSSTLYTYTVSARDAANNESAESSQASDTTFTPDVTAPTTPASLTATVVSAFQIDLSWIASTDNVGVTGYKIYRDGSLIDTITVTTYQDTGLSTSTLYTYTVSAIDAALNESAQSLSDSGTTPAAFPLYLRGNGVPEASLLGDAPTATTLPNFDSGRDADAGLTISMGGIDETESDSTKYQSWISSTSGISINGTMILTFWSAIKNFATDQAGFVQAYLLDADSNGQNGTLIVQGEKEVNPWSGGSSTWVEHTIDFGDLTYTVNPGRTLVLKIIVHNDSGDNMWFAYDTTSYESILEMN
jgi:chitodextrinase